MNKIQAKKRFSQNFLNDQNVLKKISEAIDIEGKNIIEIGPGKGALTSYLINKANKVIAFEIDYHLFDELKEKFQNNNNLEIINQDFLKINLEQYQGFDIIANIPYNISTDILFKIFQYSNNFKNVVLLVQKEYAERVCAKINDKAYGKLSISTQIFYDSKILFDVSPEVFIPKPKVTSSVIHLTKINRDWDNKTKWDFCEFVKKCFLMKRKTLLNNLKSSKFNTENLDVFFANNNLKSTVRPENLSLENFYDLYKFLTKN